MTNPFTARSTGSAWAIPVSVLSLVLGFMLTAAWVTRETRASRFGLMSEAQQARVGTGSIDLQEQVQKLLDEVVKLREDKSKLEATLASGTGSSKALNESLQEARLQAGLTELEGPGVMVTLRDNPKAAGGLGSLDSAIHDLDVLRVVNELWNAGAEAISVNGHRVAGGSNIRCAGSIILVDSVKVSPPLLIRAIGDPETMFGAMNLPGGVLGEIRSTDPQMATLEQVKSMRMPAFAGALPHKFGKVPNDKP